MARNWFYNEYSNDALLHILYDYCTMAGIPVPAVEGAGRCTIARTFERLGIDFAGW